MTETHPPANPGAGCHWAGAEHPRMMRTHLDGCTAPDCSGCQPCTRLHCIGCGRTHVDEHQHVCTACLHTTRTDLVEIVRLHATLPEEVEHRGVDSEAAHLAGPAADADQWSARGVHALSGRSVLAACDAKDLEQVQAWLDHADLDEHPLWTVARLADIVRDALGHAAPDARATVEGEADYLDGQLSTLTHDLHFDWSDLATSISRCRTHLESVLHDGEQVDTGAPCMSCGALLHRTWGTTGVPDGWRCPRCRRTSTEDQYRFAVAQLHREEATYLSDRDTEIRTGVKATTVRSWARNDQVARRTDSGRTLYAVADVLAVARSKGLLEV